MNTNRIIFAAGMLAVAGLFWLMYRIEYRARLKMEEKNRQQALAEQAWLRQTMYLNNGNYSLQIGLWQLSRMKRADIVMLGDSHTFHINWAELLGRPSLANRGIPGDITLGYLNRLQYVFALKPKICFIEGGVNDLYSGYSVEEIIENYQKIAEALKSQRIQVVIQATFLVGHYWQNPEATNLSIARLNAWLQEYAQSQGFGYIDMNPLIAHNGFLRPELTYDGLHLNADGYSLWVPAVDKALRERGF